MAQQNPEIAPGYQIRRGNAGDMDRVGEIARQAWVRIHESATKILGEELHGVLSPNWEANKEAQVRSHWERRPDWFRVVAHEGEVVAFVTFHIDPENSLGTIGNNAVAPGLAGKGIGTAMYEYVLDLFREKGLKYASVGTGLDEGHAPARRAYEKAGFDIAQEKVTYYTYL